MQEEWLHVNQTEFQVRKLLGKGKGGCSYLVTDGSGQFVLKQIHHEPCDYYQFGDKMEAELRDDQRLMEIGIKMPTLLDADIKRERILKAYIEGETIYELVLKDRMKVLFGADARDVRSALCREHKH